MRQHHDLNNEEIRIHDAIDGGADPAGADLASGRAASTSDGVKHGAGT